MPTPQEQHRYEQWLDTRPRISKEESLKMLAKLARYDKKIKLRKVPTEEGSSVNWDAVEKSVVVRKQVFNVRLQVDGEEVLWPTTAFTYNAAKKLAIRAAVEDTKKDVKAL